MAARKRIVSGATFLEGEVSSMFRQKPISFLSVLAGSVLAIASTSRAQDIVEDGSFEAGTVDGGVPSDVNPFWDESSTNFHTPLCHPEATSFDCQPEPDFGARTGSWWAWFGGLKSGTNGASPEEASLSQEVMLPADDGDSSATLRFYLRRERCSADPDDKAIDRLVVELDSQEFFAATATDPDCGSEVYQEQVVDLSSALIGAEQTAELRFYAILNGDALTNFFVDDVSLFACEYPAEVVLEEQTIASAQTFQACVTLTAGNDFVVASTGDVVLEAGDRVVLTGGFSVETGGTLRVSVTS
jgi:hypothetical protein